MEGGRIGARSCHTSCDVRARASVEGTEAVVVLARSSPLRTVRCPASRHHPPRLSLPRPAVPIAARIANSTCARAEDDSVASRQSAVLGCEPTSERVSMCAVVARAEMSATCGPCRESARERGGSHRERDAAPTRERARRPSVLVRAAATRSGDVRARPRERGGARGGGARGRRRQRREVVAAGGNACRARARGQAFFSLYALFSIISTVFPGALGVNLPKKVAGTARDLPEGSHDSPSARLG